MRHIVSLRALKKLLFFLLVLVFFVRPVCAQQIALSIYPTLLETVIKPGKSIMIAYRIGNLADPTLMRVRVLPFEPQGDTGTAIIREEESGPVRFSLDNAGLQLNEPFFLKTNQSQQILLRIRIPEGAPEGDYYYTVLAETEPPPTVEGSTSSRARASIGSHILITVTSSGNRDIKGNISFFDVLSRYTVHLFGRTVRLFDTFDAIPVVLKVANTGSNVFKPQGNLSLRGNFGETAQYDIIPYNVLRESSRLMTATPSASVSCSARNGPSYCRTPTTLVLSGFFLGKYTLSANVNFGEETPNLYSSISFFALPFKFILIMGVTTILTLLIIRKVKEEEEEV